MDRGCAHLEAHNTDEGHAVNEPKRTMPTQTLLQGKPYTNSASTNLKAKFDEIRTSMLDFSGPSLRELQARRKK